MDDDNLPWLGVTYTQCVDRFGLEMPCFMRIRVFASSKGAITASVVFLLPLQLSRLVENT